MRRKRTMIACLLVGMAVAATPCRVFAAPRSPEFQVRIVAPDMCCAGCVRTVSRQLYSARGVKNVQANISERTLAVTLSQRGGASLEALWQAVEKGQGGPTRLRTPAATYSLAATPSDRGDAVTLVAVDNLHSTECAQKIARQLYTLQGVDQVRADLAQDTLVVHTHPGTALSPWRVVAAVSKANERATSVNSPHKTLTVKWATLRPQKNGPSAQQPALGGFRR